jgi:hypothetical protein
MYDFSTCENTMLISKQCLHFYRKICIHVYLYLYRELKITSEHRRMSCKENILDKSFIFYRVFYVIIKGIIKKDQ